MPTPTLPEFVTRAMALADYRNLAVENPIPVRIPLLNGENLIVVVAALEPNNVTLPFNVSWIVADPDSADFKKVLRRTTLDPSVKYRNTWQEVTTYELLIAEAQYWDLSAGFNLGEVDVPQVGAATVETRGLVRLNREYTPDRDSPVIVGGNDPRMKNARVPLPHSHPKMPISLARGASGLNAWIAKLSSSNSPLAGQILAITGPSAIEGQWNAIWRWPVAADIAYDGPAFTGLTIKGPVGLTLDETMPFTFKADATFSDGNTLVDVPVTWAVIGNGQIASIGALTGNFQSLDIPEDQTVRVEARWTHPESGVLQVAYVDVLVKDVTVKVNLLRIEMVGLAEVEENSIATYSVIAYFDDGTNSGVTPSTFTSSNPGAGAFNSDSGVLEVGELTTDQTTVIAATYLFNGVTKAASLSVLCHDLTVYPANAVVIGPNTVDENTTIAYVLRVTYTNGTQVDVAVTDWSASDAEAGSINPTTGEFTATTNLFEDKSTTLSASYTLEGRTVSGSKQITVKDTTVYPRSAVILGSAAVNENTVSQYQFRVTFTNDTTAVVTVSNWALDNALVGTINKNTGQLVTAADVAIDTAGKLSASYTSAGVTVAAEFDVTVKDITNYPVSARVVGAAQMNEGGNQTVTFEVTYLDGTKVIEPVTNWTSSNQAAATIGAVNGVITAATNLAANGTSTIAASFSKYGRTVNADLALTVRDTTNYPVSAVINGALTVNEGTTSDYTLAVTFTDGSTANRSATWGISGGNGATINTSGRVTAPANVDANTTATLTASFTIDGRTVTATPKAITIKDTTVYPASARVLGPNSVMEGTNQTYQLEVTYTNASKAVVAVTNWASSVVSTGTINPNTGLFSALATTGNSLTKLTASYTAAGVTVGAELNITVTDATNYPVSAAIEGINLVEEGATAQYNLRVTFTDGSDALVGSLDWASATTSVGVINPSTGLFQAASNLTADGTTKLTASYESEGIRVSAEKTITVEDATVYPVSAVITGAAVVDALQTSQYEMRVTFEDATTLVMPAVWTSSNTGTGGTINASGLFTAKDNKTGVNINTTLTAEYTLDGRKVTATKVIAVHDTTNYPASVAISGPNTVASSVGDAAGTANYTAEITYLDGSKNNVPVGTWAVEGTTVSDPVGTINAAGKFTANQQPGGVNRNITIKYAYTEFGKTVNGTKSVALTVVPVPVSIAINGAASVSAGVSSSYTATVTLSDGSTQPVVPTWSTLVSSTIATLASDGVLTVAPALATDSTVKITASYSAAGLTVTADKDVSALKAVALTDITITGTSTIVSGGNASYVVKANFDDGTDATVTASTTFSSSVPAAGSFSVGTKGRFDAATVVADTDTVLTFSYTLNGVTKTKTQNLKVTAPVVAGNNRPRWGVAMFSDIDFLGGKAATDPNYDKPYTHWTGIQDFADKVMTNTLPSSNSNELFTMNLGEAQYGYFMALKSLGNATFTDTAINIDGGMGGITWTPEGEMGDVFTGIDVQYDCHDGNGVQTWTIFRTDWDSLGSITFKVRYL
ncbi:hypothetical protein D3C85_507110 [compost metagenome]